ALSMMSAGSALGGVILVPFAAYLIGLIDWRLTWVTMGLLILLLVVPLAFFFLREEPGDLGLLPDGDPAPSGRAGARALSEPSGPLVAESWRGAFRSLPIWQLCGAYFVCGFTTVVMATHMVPYAVDRGFSASTGAAAFGFMMALNLPAVLVLGVLADRFGRKNLLTLVYTLRGCGYVVLLLAPGQLGLWGFSALAGLTWVATLPLTNSLIAEVYGLRHIGILSGMAFAAHQIGGAVSIQFAGIMRDVTGSYTVPFTIAGLVLIVATLASFSIQEKKYSTRRLAVSTPAAYVE
ncbi:MAG: MFS transporter, partial [Chloroflexi bacterium]|nr:MFS transporter [Chloroflexota bacterium]